MDRPGPPDVGDASAAVFDRHAGGYDGVALSALGRVLRARVHEVLTSLLKPGHSVVDVGCGTGIDAEWLAVRVGRVRAFDPSPAMVATARRRCAHLGNVTVEVADAAQIELTDPADLVLVDFGVINCIDAAAVRSRLAPMVGVGGHLVAVTMTPWCPIELAVGVGTANPALIRRRRGGHRGHTVDTGGYEMQPRYLTARAVARELGAGFSPVHAEALGLVLPPFEQRAWIERRPRLLASLAAADRRLGPLGARLGIGDHHIVVMQRCDP